MGFFPQNNANTHADGEGLPVDAIEELVAECGVKAVVAAFLQSSVADQLGEFGSQAALRIAQVILREIAFSRNPQLEAEVMSLGAGVILADDMTMTIIGEKHGISRSAVSKRVVSFCDANALPPSIFMKSKKARGVYAKTNQPRSAS